MDWLLGTESAFAMLSPQHLIPLFLILYAIMAVYANPEWFRQHDRRVRLILCAVLIVFEIGLYWWYVHAERFAWKQSLPLQLCSLSYILTIWMLIRPTYRLYEFLYFAGVGGALQALLTPVAILSGFPHFTYQYMKASVRTGQLSRLRRPLLHSAASELHRLPAMCLLLPASY